MAGLASAVIERAQFQVEQGVFLQVEQDVQWTFLSSHVEKWLLFSDLWWANQINSLHYFAFLPQSKTYYSKTNVFWYQLIDTYPLNLPRDVESL